MKICITAAGAALNSMVDFRFGRCQYLLFIDSETGKILEAAPNDNLASIQGAGVAVAQKVASSKVGAVITGNIGPNAFRALNMAGIKVYLGGSDLSVAQILEKYQKGELKEVQESTTCGHLGARPGGRPGSSPKAR